MTLRWEINSVRSIAVDGKIYKSKNKSICVNLEKGIHKFEVYVSRASNKQLRQNLFLNWVSMIFGAFGSSIDEALSEVFEDKVSFELDINDFKDCLELDEHILLSKKTKVIDAKKLRTVKICYMLPCVLLAGMLCACFIAVGLFSIKNSQVGLGVFAFVIAGLSLFLSIAVAVRTIRLTDKKIFYKKLKK